MPSARARRPATAETRLEATTEPHPDSDEEAEISAHIPTPDATPVPRVLDETSEPADDSDDDSLVPFQPCDIPQLVPRYLQNPIDSAAADARLQQLADNPTPFSFMDWLNNMDSRFAGIHPYATTAFLGHTTKRAYNRSLDMALVPVVTAGLSPAARLRVDEMVGAPRFRLASAYRHALTQAFGTITVQDHIDLINRILRLRQGRESGATYVTKHRRLARHFQSAHGHSLPESLLHILLLNGVRDHTIADAQRKASYADALHSVETTSAIERDEHQNQQGRRSHRGTSNHLGTNQSSWRNGETRSSTNTQRPNAPVSQRSAQSGPARPVGAAGQAHEAVVTEVTLDE